MNGVPKQLYRRNLKSLIDRARAQRKGVGAANSDNPPINQSSVRQRPNATHSARIRHWLAFLGTNHPALGTLASIAIAVVGVYIAWQAKDIAGNQSELLKYQTQILDQSLLPHLEVTIETPAPSKSDSLELAVYNSGGPISQIQATSITTSELCAYTPGSYGHVDEAIEDNTFVDCVTVQMSGFFSETSYSGEPSGEQFRLANDDNEDGNVSVIEDLNAQLATTNVGTSFVIGLTTPQTLLSISYLDRFGDAHSINFVVVVELGAVGQFVMSLEPYMHEILSDESDESSVIQIAPEGLGQRGIGTIVDFDTLSAEQLVQIWQTPEDKASSSNDEGQVPAPPGFLPVLSATPTKE